MSYTWEEVMLGIDVRKETKQKQEDIESIEAIAKKEQDMMSAWSFGLSLLGGAIFGPAGYMIGKQIGKYGADYAYDWESKVVDPGKFNKDEIEEFNQDIKDEAKSQTQGQLLDSAIDLATMYVQAGGLEEGFDPSIGGGDWTTFGTGDDAWTVFGAADKTGTLGSVASEQYSGINIPFTDKVLPLARTLPGDQSLFSGGLKEAGKKLTTAAGAEQTVRNIASGGKDLKRMIEES